MKRVGDEVVKSHKGALDSLRGLRREQGCGSVRLDDRRENTIGAGQEGTNEESAFLR
jgi:hypothetical protein